MHRHRRVLAFAGCGGLGLTLFWLAIRVGSGSAPPTTVQLALAALMSSLALALFAFAGAFLSEAPLRETLGLLRGRLGPLGLVVVVLGTVGLSQLIDAFLYASGMRSGSALEVLDETLKTAEPAPLSLTLFGVGIAPGFGEEFFFRGLVMRFLIVRLGAPLGVGLSAAFFGAAHVDAAQGTGAFLLGLYLGAAALASGSTWTVVICHIANNLAALAGPLFGLFVVGSGWFTALFALLSAIAGLTLLVRALRKRADPIAN